jgi:hypothetical protein
VVHVGIVSKVKHFSDSLTMKLGNNRNRSEQPPNFVLLFQTIAQRDKEEKHAKSQSHRAAMNAEVISCQLRHWRRAILCSIFFVNQPSSHAKNVRPDFVNESI